MITQYLKRVASLLSPGQWPPILARLVWIHPLIHMTYQSRDHMILDKKGSPLQQGQWPQNLLGLSLKVTWAHPLTYRSSDYVFFKQRYISTSTRQQNSGGNNKHRNKLIWKYDYYVIITGSLLLFTLRYHSILFIYD